MTITSYANRTNALTVHESETLIRKIGDAAALLATACKGHRNRRDWPRTWATLSERFQIATAYPWQDNREAVYLSVRDRFLDAWI